VGLLTRKLQTIRNVGGTSRRRALIGQSPGIRRIPAWHSANQSTSLVRYPPVTALVRPAQQLLASTKMYDLGHSRHTSTNFQNSDMEDIFGLQLVCFCSRTVNKIAGEVIVMCL